MNPWMPEAQVKAIEEHIKPATVMLEWGSGGSTTHFAPMVKELWTIEHDPEWAGKLVNQLTDKNKFHLVLPEVPFPVPDSQHSLIPNIAYVSLVREFPNVTEHNIRRYWQFKTYVDHIETLGVSWFDLILVDGRARGMCAAKALRYMHDRSVLCIDDFFTRYEEYTDSFWNMFDLIRQVDRMCIVKRKT